MFYYLESQYMSDIYCRALINAIKENSVTSYMYINALLSQGGFISKNILAAFVSSPIKRVKGHKSFQRVIQDLQSSRIIQEFDNDHWMLSPTFFSYSKNNFARSMGIETAKRVIIDDFNNWAKSINFVGFETGKKLFESPEFANFQWAYTAPSYIQSLYNYKKEIPGFIIADIIYGRTTEINDIKFFLGKINIVRSFKKLPNFLPILLIDKLDIKAQKMLKDNKILIASLNNLFGDKYAEFLSELVNIFTNATTIVMNNPQKIQSLFNEIQKSEGRYNNVLGDLFELLVGRFYQEIGYSIMKMRYVVQHPDTGRYKEIDLLIVRDGKVIVIECKATHAKLNRTYIEKWLHENIPFFRDYLLHQYADYKTMEFQIGSVGGFSDEALDILETEKIKTKKYEITYLDYNSIYELGKEKNAHEFLSTFTRNYGNFNV